VLSGYHQISGEAEHSERYFLIENLFLVINGTSTQEGQCVPTAGKETD
jgi:hypothetical protein